MTTSKSAYRPTTLGFAILGLLAEEPRSGYAVRQVFEATALGQYSSSPGSIYPALRRLQTKGYVKKTATKRSGGIFSLTARGRRVLTSWLEEPVQPDRAPHQVQELLLKFTFMGQGVDATVTLDFLRAFREGTGRYAEELESFLETKGSGLPLHARLALRHGIDGYRSDARWAEWAEATLKQEGTES